MAESLAQQPLHLLDQSWNFILDSCIHAWDVVGPGGQLHPQGFIENKGHLLLEGLLAVVIGYLLLGRSYKPSAAKDTELSEQEIEQLCEDWTPEPLVPDVPQERKLRPPVLSSAAGRHVTINGKKVLSMASCDFLGVAGDPAIKDMCRGTIEKYGVGSCGPRGFYGTIDVHLDLERRLARFMGTEEAIIYSYDLATVPSVIPAFANAKDVLVCDEGVNWAVQNGCVLSRAKIRPFKHNDMADLRAVLQKEAADHARKRKPLNRRFIIVEGIYAGTGDLARLDEIFKLKEEFKYRLIVDESHALGVLGRHGRGACEHFGLQPSQVEIITSTMGNALGSVGGFCCGNHEMVDHQRLSGLGYCFSASLPPFLATAAIGALDVLETRWDSLQKRIQHNAKSLRSLLRHVAGTSVIGCEADDLSAVVHLQADNAQQIVDLLLERRDICASCQHRSCLELLQKPPTIRLVVTARHEEEDLQRTADALHWAASAAATTNQSP